MSNTQNNAQFLNNPPSNPTINQPTTTGQIRSTINPLVPLDVQEASIGKVKMDPLFSGQSHPIKADKEDNAKKWMESIHGKNSNNTSPPNA